MQEEWLPFTEVEIAILLALLDVPALSRHELARHLDESPDGKLKAAVASLCARRVLINSPAGYAINAPESRRGPIRTWLESLRSPAGGIDAANSSRGSLGG